MQFYSNADAEFSPPLNEVTDKVSITFPITLTLAKDETLRIERISCSSVELQQSALYLPIRFLTPKISRKRAELAVLQNDGSRIENGTVLHGDTNTLSAELKLDTSDRAAELQKCRNLRFSMNYHLCNGTILTNRVRIPHEHAEGTVKIHSILTRTVLWALSFFIIVALVYFIMKWGSGHGRVYRAIRISPELIVAIGTGILVYLGIPNVDNVSSLRREGFFGKLKSYLAYPEYYFDPLVVKSVRHWSALLALVLLAWVSFELLQRYKTYDLPAGTLPSGMVLYGKSDAQPIAIESACDTTAGQSASSWTETLERTASHVADFVRTHWSADSISNPEQIYDRDIDSTCVAIPSQIDEAPFCVGDLQRDGTKVIVDWYDFESTGIGKPLNKIHEEPLTREELRKQDDFVIAMHYLNGQFREEWDVRFSRKEQDCETIHIATKYLEPDVQVYLDWLAHEATKVRNRSEPTFKVGTALNNETDFEKLDKDIQLRVNRVKRESFVDADLEIAHADHISHWTIQEFTSLLTEYWSEQVRKENRDKVSEQDVPGKEHVPNVFLFSYGDNTKSFMLEAISMWWLSMEHYLHYYYNDSDSSPQIQPLKEFTEQVRREFRDKEIGKNCRDFDKYLAEKADGSRDSFCNSVRDVYADFIVVLLSLEKTLDKTGLFHALILDTLLSEKGNGKYYIEDVRNYLVLSAVLNQLGTLDSDRMKFFEDQYLEATAESYGCSFQAVMQRREAEDMVTPAGYKTNKDFGTCEEYFE
jgi:hypothetical protein